MPLLLVEKRSKHFPKPLPNRLNIVVSRNPSLVITNHSNVIRVSNFEQGIKCADDDSNIENIFIAGGVSIYEEAMKNNLVQRLFVTRVKGDFHCTAVWSSFDVSNYKRLETIPDEYQQFFDHSNENREDKDTPICHLEIYDRNL